MGTGHRGSVGVGLVVDDTGFEVLASGQRIGPRRVIGPDDVEMLTRLASQYVRAVQAGADAGVFVELGRELYGWLEGDQGQLTGLLEHACSGRILGRWFDLGLRHRHDRHPCVSRWLTGCW
jgi:hypothetical protein